MSNGFINEYELISSLDNKHYNELNSNLQSAIRIFFKGSNYNSERIIARHCTGQGKPDISIKIGSVEKLISIKIGTGNSVHQEPVETFIEYLGEQFGITEEIADCIRHFIWGDDTLDGCGMVCERLSASQYRNSFPDKITKLKEYFETHKSDLIKRFVLIGKNGIRPIDFLYHGNVINGSCISAEDILNFLTDGCNTSRSAVPVGGLCFQAWNRVLNGNTYLDSRRGVIQLKWPSLEADLHKLIKR